MDTRNPFEDDDGEKQCRTCLALYYKHQLYSLDSKNLTVMDNGSEQTLVEIYHQCTQLLYKPADDHCKWICQYCVEKMVDFFQFREMCINSYNTLKLSEMSKSENHHMEEETELNDSIVIKEENDFIYDNIHLDNTIDDTRQTVSDDCKSNNTILDGETTDNRTGMALRKRKTIPSGQCVIDTITDRNDEDNQNDKDVDFNDDVDFADDDSSSNSSVSDQKVNKYLYIVWKISF